MKKSPATGKSLIASVGILFLFFTGLALAISNEFLFSYLEDSRHVSPFLRIVAGFFFLLLLGILLVQGIRLLSALRRKEVAIQYRLRLVFFFVLIAVLASLPTVILTANILRNSFDVWFVRDTNASLAFGLDMALDNYRIRHENLQGFARSATARDLAMGCIRNPKTGWERMQAVNRLIDGVRIISSEGDVILQAGDGELIVDLPRARVLSGGQVQKMQTGRKAFLAAGQPWDEGAGNVGVVVFMTRLPEGFDRNADLLSRTELKLRQYRDFGLSFPLYAFAAYLLLVFPLLILAVLVGLHVSDLLIGPLVQMDESVKRVRSGDFRTRLLARPGDVMAPFITSFNSMVEELEDSRHMIQQAERVQTWQDIAQRLAHEIKNPLTPIRLSAERILRKYRNGSPDLGKVIEENVDVIVHEVDGLASMLSEFRDFARLPLPSPSDVDLRDLLETAWGLYAGSVDVEMKMILPEGVHVHVDRGQLLQVFRNLFQNAIDAMAGHAGELVVQAFPLEKGGESQVRISMQDNGCGMDSQTLARIFDPYFTSKSHGTGLGLAICEKILLDHGGRIWAESQPDRGSCFFIDLRCRQVTE